MNNAGIHEASHAAIYLTLDRADVQIIELTLDGNAGFCHFRSRLPPVANATIAGYVGEMRAIEGKDWRPTPEMFKENLHLQDISDAVKIVGLEGMPALWDECAEILDLHWGKILAIADALTERGKLSGNEVDEIWRKFDGLNSY